MRIEEKKNYLAYMDFIKELKIVESRGVGLLLDGKVSEAEDIARACVLNDEVTYTKDYIASADGKGDKLNFKLEQFY